MRDAVKDTIQSNQPLIPANHAGPKDITDPMNAPGPENLFVDDCGSALLEFALLFSSLLVLMVGVTDYCFVIHQAMVVQEAAVAGATFGAIPGNENNTTGMKAAATSAAQGVGGFTVTAVNLWTCTPGGSSVSSMTLCTGGITPYKYVVVKANASVPRPLSLPSISSNGTVYGSATFRVPWSQ